MCSTRACRPAAPMVLALTDTGSARTGRGVICTPAFCMAFASAAGSGAGSPFLGGGGDLVVWFPVILVSMLILAYLGKGIFNVMAALVVLEWAYYARTARGQALVER